MIRFAAHIIFWEVLFLFWPFHLHRKDHPTPKAFHLSGQAQGTSWHATYYSPDSTISKHHVDSILNLIDSSLSIYKPYSTIIAFNNSNKGVLIDKHFRTVIEKSIVTYDQTKGLFDITIGPLTEAWGFGAGSRKQIPDDAMISQLLECIDTKNIVLRNDSLIKLKSCVKIDVNGIAQGYTVDVIASLFESLGIHNYLVELGGEMRVKGKKQPSGEPFRIGIESPSSDDFTQEPMQQIIVLDSGAITTSGNYRKYHESNGTKYSHILDPKTGKSVKNEMISVTVYAPDAITADAYDNALMLMGVDGAMNFLKKHKNIGAFIIYKQPNGSIADTANLVFQQLISDYDSRQLK